MCTVVTHKTELLLHWNGGRGGKGVGGRGAGGFAPPPPLPLVFNYSKEALGVVFLRRSEQPLHCSYLVPPLHLIH